MKNVLVVLLIMLFFPGVCCLIYHLFDHDLKIGGGGDKLEDHYMGKDVLIEEGGLYKSIDVEEYVAGIMAGVIPADYAPEVLMVQAVLVRTNVLKEMEENNTKDDSDMSYEYLTKEERKKLWGRKKYEEYESNIEQAVLNTSGMVIKNEDSLIMAMYHEVSIGKTASAAEILGEDVSYLQSVDSSTDVEAKDYMNLYDFSYEDIAKAEEEYVDRLLKGMSETEKGEEAEKDVSVSGTEEDALDGVQETNLTVDKISIDDSTENGFVKEVSVGNNTYTGQEFADMLELASTNFYVEDMEKGVRIVCLGKGSCLGVSQYGANCMAQKGSKMEDIIKYYYKDVTIESVLRN